MIKRMLHNFLKWGLALAGLAGLFTGAYWFNREMQAERLREGGEQVESPRRAKDGVVLLAAEDASRMGLKEAAVRVVSWTERVPVYGEVVPNPKASAEVRSPFAGTLRADPDTPWPAPGRWVKAGQHIGWVDIRVGPQDRLSLQDNLNNARLKKKGAERVVALQRERVKRIEQMSRSQIVPGQQLDDAKVLLAEAETQLAIAAAAVELWQQALEDVDRPDREAASTYSQPLRAAAEGEVTELNARPGMVVEAGSLVVQLVDFRRALVRVNVPADIAGAGLPPRLMLTAVKADAPGGVNVLDPANRLLASRQVEAALVGLAPQVDEASQFLGCWYGFEPDPAVGTAEEGFSSASGTAALWRPGLHVKALVTLPSASVQKAAAIPWTAVLFHQGRTLVYRRVKPNAYERREVRLLAHEGDSWVVGLREDATGLGPDDVVVSQGAQALLSEELRSDVDMD